MKPKNERAPFIVRLMLALRTQLSYRRPPNMRCQARITSLFLT